jgi:hypothetical protein
MNPYPISSDYWVNQREWRDLEFWNKSVDRESHYPLSEVFVSTGFWFPKSYIDFDRRTGAADASLTPYVLSADQETRFRLSGTAEVDDAGVTLIAAAQPWRLDWLTSGLYLDGWTKPHVVARVRLFPALGQQTPRTRYLSLAFRAPDPVSTRAVFVTSNLDHWSGTTSPATTRAQIRVCLPAHGFTEVRVRTPDNSAIPPNLLGAGGPREGGVFIAQVALADEIGPRCSPHAPSRG